MWINFLLSEIREWSADVSLDMCSRHRVYRYTKLPDIGRIVDIETVYDY